MPINPDEFLRTHRPRTPSEFLLAERHGDICTQCPGLSFCRRADYRANPLLLSLPHPRHSGTYCYGWLLPDVPTYNDEPI